MNKFCDWLSEMKVISVHDLIDLLKDDFYSLLHVFYCHNQPITKLDSIDRWPPAILACVIMDEHVSAGSSRSSKVFRGCWGSSHVHETGEPTVLIFLLNIEHV